MREPAYPQRNVCNNRPEFISRALAIWAAYNRLQLAHIQWPARCTRQTDADGIRRHARLQITQLPDHTTLT